MSTRTAQCQECADVFEAGPRGPLPKLCPKCKADDGERESNGNGRRNGRRKKAEPVRLQSGSGAIATAILALQEEISAMESGIEQRREALAALEAIGA